MPPTVADLLRAALAGSFPQPDGGTTRVAPWRTGVEAVLAFTGHAFLAVDPTQAPDDAALARLGADGYGGAHHPRVMTALAGEGAWFDVLDAVLVAPGGRAVPDGAPRLVRRPDLDDHPRVAYARGLRDDVVALGLPDPGARSVVTLGCGLGGLPEIGVETHRPDGVPAAALVRAALAGADPGECVVAAVAPGNARALRAFLGAGFTPVASVQLFRREG